MDTQGVWKRQAEGLWNGFDARIKAEVTEAVDWYRQVLIFSAENCQSPIEQLMCLRLLQSQWIHQIQIQKQAPIRYKSKVYYADFLITCRETGSRLVVECDGHEFHEKTKEQAARDKARDRHMQSLGMVVLRFTGSEIWNNLVRCAEEIEDVLYRLVAPEEYAEVQRMNTETAEINARR